jgi:HAD superfamily phosphoserine phosphatase-like hydrolase
MTPLTLDPTRLHVFCDFDGTITQTDTLVVLAERVGAGIDDRREVDRLLRDGRMTLREALTRNLASLRVPFAEAASMLRAAVQVDRGFPRFAEWCVERGIPLSVLSGGLHDIIELFLPPADFPSLDVRANRLAPGTWRCVFRDDSPAGHDKRAALEAAARGGRRTVYVGDGLSDLEPAAVADVVFARRRSSLAAHCRARGITCAGYDGFDDVLRALAARVRDAA